MVPPYKKVVRVYDLTIDCALFYKLRITPLLDVLLIRPLGLLYLDLTKVI